VRKLGRICHLELAPFHNELVDVSGHHRRLAPRSSRALLLDAFALQRCARAHVLSPPARFLCLGHESMCDRDSLASFAKASPDAPKVHGVSLSRARAFVAAITDRLRQGDDAPMQRRLCRVQGEGGVRRVAIPGVVDVANKLQVERAPLLDQSICNARHDGTASMR
jgi:hypothetical protein